MALAPAVAQIRALRDRWALDYVQNRTLMRLAAVPDRSLPEWRKLLQPRTNLELESDMDVFVENLDRLVDQWQMTGAAERQTLCAEPSEKFPEFCSLLERQRRWRGATTAAEFLQILKQLPLDAGARIQKFGNGFGYVSEAQVEQFVALQPSPEQYLDFIRENQQLNYGTAAAPLVHSLADLYALTEPPDMPVLARDFIYHESLDLVRAVVARPGAAHFLTERDLDTLMTARQMGEARASLPPLVDCASLLKERN